MSLKRCAIVAIASIAVATATSVPAIAMEEVTDTVEKNYTNELLDKSLLEAKEADENSDSPVNNYFYTLTVPESINLHNTDKCDIGTGVYNNNDACKVNIRGNVLPNQIVTVAVSDAILHRNGSKDVAAKVDTSSKTVWNYDDLTAGELGTTDTEPTGTTTVYPVSAALTPGDWFGTIAFKCTLETLPRIDEFVVGLEPTSFEYDGEEHSPKLVFAENAQLEEGTDYVISGDVAKSEEGNYSITITGNGKYACSVTYEWSIIKRDIADYVVGLDKVSFEEDGTIHIPNIVWKDGVSLVESTDYTVSGTKSSSKSGDYVISIIGKGKYKGTTSLNWRINEKPDVSKIILGLSPDHFDYDGTEKAPELMFAEGYKNLEKDIDYTVSGNTSATDNGDYTLTVKGIGRCKGTVQFKWEIRELIPVGGTYTIFGAKEALVGDGESVYFPITFHMGDVYKDAEYMYSFGNNKYNVEVSVIDKTKKNYDIKIRDHLCDAKINSLQYTFSGCENLISMPTIPDTIEDLTATFKGCKALINVTDIPNSVINLDSTFSGCSSLTDPPAIPNKVKSMDGTFSNCSSLKESPAIPDSVVNLTYTFYGCSSLVEAPIIPDNVTNLDNTFFGCKSLAKIPVIPDGVTNMRFTFFGCSSLTETPVIPDGVTNLSSTFCGCSGLTETPVIPDGVTNLSSTFYGCSGLTETPVIPDGVTNLSSTFYGCSGLTETPVIPDGVTNLNSTFRGCSSLTETPTIPDGITSLNSTFYGCSRLTKAPIIPGSVTDMRSTFRECDALTETPNIPNGVTSLTSTFQSCQSLIKAPTIPDSVTDMSSTFYGCSSLIEAPVIPDGVTSMTYTFRECASLTKAPIIPSGVKNMTCAFYRCGSIKGTLICNANPTSYGKALYITQITAVEGSCSDETKANLMATIGTTKNQMVANEQEVVLEKTLIDDEVSSVSTESKACDDADESSDNNQPAASEAIISDSSDIVQEADSSTCLPSIETKNTATQPSGE